MEKDQARQFRPLPPPFIMDTADLEKLLVQIPEHRKVEIYTKIIFALGKYHHKCHEARVLLADELDMIIHSVEQ
jgi:hypothetical protein